MVSLSLRILKRFAAQIPTHLLPRTLLCFGLVERELMNYKRSFYQLCYNQALATISWQVPRETKESYLQEKSGALFMRTTLTLLMESGTWCKLASITGTLGVTADAQQQFLTWNQLFKPI